MTCGAGRVDHGANSLFQVAHPRHLRRRRPHLVRCGPVSGRCEGVRQGCQAGAAWTSRWAAHNMTGTDSQVLPRHAHTPCCTFSCRRTWSASGSRARAVLTSRWAARSTSLVASSPMTMWWRGTSASSSAPRHTLDMKMWWHGTSAISRAPRPHACGFVHTCMDESERQSRAWMVLNGSGTGLNGIA
jgi:hypothetical protein